MAFQLANGTNEPQMEYNTKILEGELYMAMNCPTFIMLPVVLAETTITVPINARVTLPEPALKIKDIRKNLKVTQCLLLLDPAGSTTSVPLFIKGFVRKNIQYAVRRCSNAEGVCGDIRHCTVDVPFQCTTQVSINGTPPVLPLTNLREEFAFFRSQPLSGPGFAEKDRLLSGDSSEFNQVSQEYFTELPYCELIHSRIVEYDEHLNRRVPAGVTLPFEEREFRTIEEKAVLAFTVKVLQKQLVAIPGQCAPLSVSGIGPGTFRFTQCLGPEPGFVTVTVTFTGAGGSLTGTVGSSFAFGVSGVGTGSISGLYTPSPSSQSGVYTVTVPAGGGFTLTVSCPEPADLLTTSTGTQVIDDGMFKGEITFAYLD